MRGSGRVVGADVAPRGERGQGNEEGARGSVFDDARVLSVRRVRARERDVPDEIVVRRGVRRRVGVRSLRRRAAAAEDRWR